MKRSTGLLALVIAGLSMLPGCGEKSNEQQGKRTGLVVINVLDEDTYSDCHIAGSINVPFDQIEAALETIEKDADVVFYCSNPMCTSSEYAAIQFQKAGFTNVSVYEGGTAEWYQKGLPVEGASTAAYLRGSVEIHPCDSHACKVLTAEELAEKLGVELPIACQAVELPATERVNEIEIPAQK